jgi:hypothetical protein
VKRDRSWQISLLRNSESAVAIARSDSPILLGSSQHQHHYFYKRQCPTSYHQLRRGGVLFFDLCKKSSGCDRYLNHPLRILLQWNKYRIGNHQLFRKFHFTQTLSFLEEFSKTLFIKRINNHIAIIHKLIK